MFELISLRIPWGFSVYPRDRSRLGKTFCSLDGGAIADAHDECKQADLGTWVKRTGTRPRKVVLSLYRAIDHDGNLVDSMLSEKRNMEAAQRFFKQAAAVVGHWSSSVFVESTCSDIISSRILRSLNRHM